MAELVVALDFPTADAALALARQVREDVRWVKVGLELFTANGPALVQNLQELGFRIFLDLKFFDIPNTVQGAARSAARLGVDMFNVHVLGGERMIHAALEGRDQGALTGGDKPAILGVTVLTSMAEADLQLLGGGSPADVVVELAGRARQWGLEGVVCSGQEVEAVKTRCGSSFFCLTPGIRATAGGDDQRRTMTAAEAVRAGSDFLVVGRPITAAPSPAEAAAFIRREMAHAS